MIKNLNKYLYLKNLDLSTGIYSKGSLFYVSSYNNSSIITNSNSKKANIESIPRLNIIIKNDIHQILVKGSKFKAIGKITKVNSAPDNSN